MKKVLTNISYQKGTGTFLGLSFDMFLEDGSVVRQKEEIVGKNITISKVSHHKTCTGRYDLASMKSAPCPHQSILYGSSKVCEDCERRTGFSPFFYNQEKISDAQKKYNATPHLVYLAYFGGDEVKIGITSQRRGLARIQEQGALMRKIIGYYENADQARRIEEIGSTYAGCKEHFHVSRKLLYIQNSQIDFEHARQLFDKKLTLIAQREHIPLSSQEYGKSGIYEKYEARLNDVTHNISKKNRLSGSILGVIGSLLIVEQGAHLLLHNLKPRIGYELEITSGIEEMTGIISQGSLF